MYICIMYMHTMHVLIRINALCRWSFQPDIYIHIDLIGISQLQAEQVHLHNYVL